MLVDYNWFFTKQIGFCDCKSQKSRARNISEAEGRAFKMARRVGGGTRRATFEIQSEFFRKESTNLQKLDSEKRFVII